jgi:hypothetical protein
MLTMFQPEIMLLSLIREASMNGKLFAATPLAQFVRCSRSRV